MSSQTRDTRGDRSGLDLRTLAIAALAAGVAAVVVSRIWTAGTPIAAAATPVIVTILKELLDRPTARIAERMTTDSPAIRETQVREPETRATEVTPPDDHTPGDVRIYRQEGAGAGAARRINPKVVAITAALAFVIAGVVITGGQALAGNPFGKDGDGSIFLGQHKSGEKKKDKTTETETETTPQQTETVTTPQQQEREPQQTTTAPQQQQDPQQNLKRDQQNTTTTPTETTTTPGN